MSGAMPGASPRALQAEQCFKLNIEEMLQQAAADHRNDDIRIWDHTDASLFSPL